MSDERLSYRIPEVLAITGLKRRTLYKLMAEGDIRAVKAGRVVVIPRAELLRWLSEGIEVVVSAMGEKAS